MTAALMAESREEYGTEDRGGKAGGRKRTRVEGWGLVDLKEPLVHLRRGWAWDSKRTGKDLTAKTRKMGGGRRGHRDPGDDGRGAR